MENTEPFKNTTFSSFRTHLDAYDNDEINKQEFIDGMEAITNLYGSRLPETFNFLTEKLLNITAYEEKLICTAVRIIAKRGDDLDKMNVGKILRKIQEL
jgi:hypothetical protein|tara:strand:- start:118 stop:414 length:297 start_codon:yes stop_codon:yes gene_type:complete